MVDQAGDPSGLDHKLVPPQGVATELKKTARVWLGVAVLLFVLMALKFHHADYASYECFTHYYPLIEHVRLGWGETQHPMIPPLLPWVQGLFMRLVGITDMIHGAQVLNMGLLLPLNLLVLWGLVQRLARSPACRWPVALLGMAFVLLNPLIIWRSLTTGNELLYSFCLNTMLLLALRYRERRDGVSLILLALLSGLCALIRAEGIIWSGVLSLAVLGLHRLSALAFRRVALVWMVVALVWFPRLAFMQQTTGVPVLDIRALNLLQRITPKGTISDNAIGPYMNPVVRPRRTALTWTLEQAVRHKPTQYYAVRWRLETSLRGVMITFGPLALLYLLLFWPAVRRAVAGAWQGRQLLILHGIYVPQFLIVTLTVWFEERYGSTMIVLLALTSGIIFYELVTRLPKSCKLSAHVCLAGVMVAWLVLVLWKLPSHQQERTVADALRDRLPPAAVVMSVLPELPYYLDAAWCPVPDGSRGRVKVTSDQLIEICREAKVDAIIYGDFPMYRCPGWWQPDARSRGIIQRFSMPLKLPTEFKQPPLVIDARRMLREYRPVTSK